MALLLAARLFPELLFEAVFAFEADILLPLAAGLTAFLAADLLAGLLTG